MPLVGFGCLGVLFILSYIEKIFWFPRQTVPLLLLQCFYHMSNQSFVTSVSSVADLDQGRNPLLAQIHEQNPHKHVMSCY